MSTAMFQVNRMLKTSSRKLFAAAATSTPTEAVNEAAPEAEVEHYSVQFSAHNGYLLSLPCPEAGEMFVTDSDGVKTPLTVHKNGYGGAVHLVQDSGGNVERRDLPGVDEQTDERRVELRAT